MQILSLGGKTLRFMSLRKVAMGFSTLLILASFASTFIKGLNNLLNANTDSVTIYTLMMLHGTEFKNPQYRDKFKYKGKFRIVPLNFGEYDGQRIMDCEEVGVENKDLSFEDYLYIRVLALLVLFLIQKLYITLN